MDRSWLRFASDVTVRSARPVEECVRSLQALTAPPNSYSHDERRLPFRGKIASDGGSLRLSLFPLTFGPMPSRVLRFAFVSTASGTELRGQWLLLKRIRIPVAIYLTFCLISEIVELFRVLWIHPTDPHINPVAGLVEFLFFGVVAFAGIYGWTWWVVLLNRSAEDQLVRAVFHAMDSEQSAKIVGELLCSPQ
jgi:hypothetical protein